MRSTAALLLLLGCGCCLTGSSRAEEVQGEDAQEVDADIQDATNSIDNGFNDIAVAAAYHNENLYMAITTDGALAADDNAGGTDFVIRYASADDLSGGMSEQFGGDGDDIVTAMAVDEPVRIVIVGSTFSEDDALFDIATNSDETSDWFIAVLDSSTLEMESAYVNGTIFEGEEATAVGVDPDGDAYYVAGTTFGDYFDTNEGSRDWWVVKMGDDLDDDPIWSTQFGTAVDDVPTALVVGDDGVFVVGNVQDNENDLTDAELEETTAVFVYAFDRDDGDVLWSLDEGELGFLSDSSAAYGAVLNDDESELFVSGNTRGIIDPFDGDTTDVDELFVLSIDPDDGAINWVWQSEANATAFGTGGVVMADDGISPIISGIAFGNQFNLSFTYWENGNGDMIAAKIDPVEMEVSKYFVAAAASNETREDALSMVKDPDVVDGVFLVGKQDGNFLDEDVEPEADPDSDSGENMSNYLGLKVQLDPLPEEEEEDTGPDYPYWYIGVPVFAIGGILFVVAYKWAAASQAAKAKQATMV